MAGVQDDASPLLIIVMDKLGIINGKSPFRNLLRDGQDLHGLEHLIAEVTVERFINEGHLCHVFFWKGETQVCPHHRSSVSYKTI